ncbi:MAG: cytochrome d ubiquinol oxidase subunit I [Saprospiraceae bacterium]|jgi:cytochrome d ubiquinol oxidase subunit I
MLLRGKKIRFHQEALKIALIFGAIAAFAMPITGDFAAKDMAKRQPAKLAAMEAHYHTSKRATLIIGGIPNDETKELKYAIEIPGGLSFLAHGDFNAEVIGLDQIPEDECPPTIVVHFAFQTMVALGSLMMIIGFLYFFMRWRKWDYINMKWWLRLIALATPIGFIALEAGWTVTEVGRQPWIIYGVMKTQDALTPMPGIQYSLLVVVMVYSILTLAVIWLMHRQLKFIHEKYNT